MRRIRPLRAPSPRVRSLVPVALAAAALTVTGLTSAAPAQAQDYLVGAPTPPAGSVAHTWAALYMSDSHDYTAAEATALANKFDLVASMPIALKQYSASMRATNPDLELIAYSNATMLRKTNATGLPESSFAHDAAGNRIEVPEFAAYLMQSTDPTWRAYANNQCTSRSTEGGYDGCLVDMLGMGVFSKGYISSVPADPTTHVTYTEAQYRDRMIDLAAYYQQQSPSLIHIGNAVQNAWRYWMETVPSRGLVSNMASAQMEDFLRGSGDAATDYPNAESWLRNVEVIRDFESRGQTGLFTTKVWSTATEAQVAAWQKYATASFLMGANGKTYFAFTRSRDKAGAMQTNAPYSMPSDLGMPTGAMALQANGAYARPFANGLTLVNPGTTTVTQNLVVPMKNLDGQSVTSITLPPRSGEVLTGAPGVIGPLPEPVPVDTAAPTATITSLTASGGVLRASGTAADDVAVSWARWAVKNTVTKQWLRRDGTWGAYQELGTSLGAAPAGSKVRSMAVGSAYGRVGAASTWTAQASLRPGKYGVTVVVRDTAGKTNPNPRPWQVITVS